MKNTILFILLYLVVSSTVNAQIVTDRPDQTESSSTVGNHNLQIESGFLIAFEGDRFPASEQILAPTTLFRYGITKGIELRFLSQFERQKIGDEVFRGISDIEVGTKIQLFQNENVNTEIAFLSHLVIPTGSNELSLNSFGSINKISIAHDLNEYASIGYNIGYNYLDSGSGDLTYSIALGVGVNDKVGVYIEPFGELANFEDFSLNCDAGVTYLANENLQFDISFGTGLNLNMNYIAAGFSWLLKREEN